LLQKVDAEDTGEKDEVAVKSVRRMIHSTIRKVTHAFEHGFAFNVAIAALMELANCLQAYEPGGKTGHATFREGMQALLTMLAPFVPHFACEAGERLGIGHMTVVANWPQVDEAALAQDEVMLVVQIQGKKRGEITIAKDAGQDEALAAARADVSIAKWVEGMHIVKVILVPGRLLNIVVRPQ